MKLVLTTRRNCVRTGLKAVPVAMECFASSLMASKSSAYRELTFLNNFTKKMESIRVKSVASSTKTNIVHMARDATTATNTGLSKRFTNTSTSHTSKLLLIAQSKSFKNLASARKLKGWKHVRRMERSAKKKILTTIFPSMGKD